MTIEHYLTTLYVVIGVLISFHYRMAEKDESTFWVIFTGIIWPFYVLFCMIYNFCGDDD